MQINILEYLEKTVNLVPNKIAVIDSDNQLAFKDLVHKAKSLAAKIINFGFINQPIAVFLPKSSESIISDIAITYSGNIYMNLDIKTPYARITNILYQINPSVIITNLKFFSLLRDLDPNIKVVIFEQLDFNKETNDKIIKKRLNKIIDLDPYCIINTSGSTGTPKGVVLNHKSFIDFTEWAIDTLHISNDEIIGSLSPLVFDIYSFELCMLMSKGNTLFILPDTLAAFPAKLLYLIEQNKINFIFWVPTIMVNIANMDLLSKVKLNHLKTIWFAGEVFPTKQFNYWRKNLQNAKFVNLYGPIEITLDCTFYVIERDIQDNEPIPIGFPCRNTDVLILNDNNQISSKDEEGELCVRGSSLAMGYYNNELKTAENFVQNPLNKSYHEIIYRTGDIVYKNEQGELIFKGRKDNLIKHLGYRIELNEIEHVLINTLKLIQNGCVVYNSHLKEITLFYEAYNTLSVSEFREELGKVLPKYMVPSKFYKMDNLPRNANGKIDRLFLSQQINI